MGSEEGLWVMETVETVGSKMHKKARQSSTKLEMAMTCVGKTGVIPAGMYVFFHQDLV